MSQKPLPRIPEIILRPDLISFNKKTVLAFVAMIGWIIWLYIISPVFSLLAWWFGYQQLNIFVLDDPARTMQTLQIYAYVILGGGLIFILWASYNWIRFRKSHRRGAHPIANAEEIGHTLGLTEAQILFARQHKTMTFSFDEAGNIIGME